LAEGVDQVAGRTQHGWDGRDDSGRVVPDEVYTFVIETVGGTVYDPRVAVGPSVSSECGA